MTESPIETPEYEWSHPVDVSKVNEDGMILDIDAPKENYAALCRRLNLEDIHELKGKVKLERNAVTKILHVSGDLYANVDQKCVVTGEPVAEKVSDSFESWYAEPNDTVSFTKAKRDRMNAKEREELPMLEEFDDPEEIVNGKIDLGELLVQFLSLSLDPYPRVAGARGNFGDELEEAPEGTYNNPFAALKDWKIKEKNKE
jgi:hypothetical protein